MSGFLSGRERAALTTISPMKKVSRVTGIVVLGLLCGLVTLIDRGLAKRQYARAVLFALVAMWLAWSCLRP